MIPLGRRIKTISEDFFDFDEERKICFIRLEFGKPSDIFDHDCLTKTPMLSDDFIEWITTSFEYVPRRYKIDLDIAFDDLEGYDEDNLKDIFIKNMLLEAKRSIGKNAVKNRIAIGLVIIGLVFLVSMILLMNFWTDGGIAREIVSYVFDIATTVTFWEALSILIIENKQKRDLAKNWLKKYDNIKFHRKVKTV